MHRTVPLFRPYGVREARMEDEMDELIRLALNEVQALFAHWESFYGESLRLLVSGPRLKWLQSVVVYPWNIRSEGSVSTADMPGRASADATHSRRGACECGVSPGH